MNLTAIFGTGVSAEIIKGALGLGCALVMALCPAATIAYKVAALLGPLLDLAGGASAAKGPAPVIISSSSALHAGSAPPPAAPAPKPAGPVVLQRAPEVDQEGLP